MTISGETKSKLLDPHHRKCPVCGRTDIDLHICHIVPSSAGGADDIANLAFMCPSCHASFDRYQPTEMEFTAFLADLLNRHPDYSETRMESRLSATSPLRADLTTIEGKKGKRTILVECKRTTFFTERRLQETIAQIQSYKNQTRFDVYVLAFPGRLPLELKQRVVSAGVDLWDVDFIATRFARQVKSTSHPFFKGLFLSVVPISDQPPQLKLLERLKNCHPGKDDWSDYQRLIGQIFEELFCPPAPSSTFRIGGCGRCQQAGLGLPELRRFRFLAVHS